MRRFITPYSMNMMGIKRRHKRGQKIMIIGKPALAFAGKGKSNTIRKLREKYLIISFKAHMAMDIHIEKESKSY